MQPSSRQQELERLYNSRKGHVPHISISDESHHVTEAIGSYYGDDVMVGNPIREARPLSYMHSPSDAYESKITRRPVPTSPTSPTKSPQNMDFANEKLPSPTDEFRAASKTPKSVKRMGSVGAENMGSQNNGQPSPPPLTRQRSSDTAVQQFPLNDIDYESSPAAVAQELSNLQAIRRMSMNVDMADPDLPSFGGNFGSVPTVAPTHEDENDAARLFWVPARLHPELAPKEFKTFVEDRVEKIRRRSGGEDGGLSPDGLERSPSGDSLRRKKSMLSHQIDTKGNYEDGAERLERKRSKGVQLEGSATVANLADLETLVSDPQQLIRRMSLETARRRSEDSGADMDPNEDMPILPPVGQSLKRSTRTTYGRGSLKRGERVPFSKRAQQRHQQQVDSETEPDSPRQSTTASSPADAGERPLGLGLIRAQTEPIPQPAEEESSSEGPEHDLVARRRPQPSRGRSDEALDVRAREDATPPPESARDDQLPPGVEQSYHHPPRTSSQQPRHFQSRLASGPGRTTAQLPGYVNTNPLPNPLPHILESLPDGSKQLVQGGDRRSHDPRPVQRGGAHMRPVPGRQRAPSTNFDDISSNPSPMPGSGQTRTDALTMIPVLNEPRKSEKKEGSRKSSWKWILGNDDDDKEKKSKSEKQKDNDASSLRANKNGKSSSDKVRLDVLQSSIDGGSSARGRESLVLNRDEIRIDDDRRKDGKKTSESRKDKDKEPGLLSAIFGGKKKSSDNDVKDKKRRPDRGLSPDPPQRILKADIDYNWTRFSILEERAIYRMAHIKLANPRRALYSQVLLSNFMYSYLAKVQMMHPQMQISSSSQQRAAQSKQAEEQQQQQPAEYSQYQRWQEEQSRQEAASNGGQQHVDNSEQPLRRASYEVATGEYEDEQEDYGQQQTQPQPQPQPQQHRDHSGAGSSGRTNGAERGYSVSSTKDYLGLSEQSYGNKSLWDDDDEKGEELW